MNITYKAVIKRNIFHVQTYKDGVCVEAHPHDYEPFTQNEEKEAIDITLDEFRGIIKNQNSGTAQTYSPVPAGSR